MSPIKRRHFLQLAGSTLFTLGLSQFELQRQSFQFAKAMAKSTSRKLALLVGVNGYESRYLNPLWGCVTDAELMKELLVHRFGFNPDDVLLVTDKSEIKPTRAGILQAFEEHLIAQAKPGDVALFHFSGHGNQISDQPDCDAIALGVGNQCVTSTLCPSDSFAAGTTFQGGVVNDITGHTLFLLMSRVATENMTVVLDSCHSGGGTRGNYLVRSVSRLGGSEAFLPSPAEKELQRRLLAELGMTSNDFIRLRREGVAKGVVIASAQRNQFAYDVPFADFSAGAFTYTMSRYLWQQGRAESFTEALKGISLKARSQAGKNRYQDLLVEYAPRSQNQREPFFFLEPETPAAEAVILEGATGGSIPFWLGGVSAQALEAYSSDTFFIAIDASGKQIGRLKQMSRQGLKGYGTVVKGRAADFVPGTLLREEILGLPTDLRLKVGLHESLGSDSGAVKSVLETMSRIEVVPLEQSQGVDYIVGRLQDEGRRSLKRAQVKPLPPISTIGLFGASLEPLMDSFRFQGDPIDVMGRLRQKFKSLLAARILKLMGGGGNLSELKVQAEILNLSDRGRATIATRPAKEAGLVKRFEALRPFKPETEVKIEVTNHESKDLYISALVINSDGNLNVLYPVDWEAPESASLVAAGESLIIPRSQDKPFITYGPAGTFELLLLASRRPLRHVLRGLQRIAESRGVSRGEFLGLEANEPTEVMDALLGDLDDQKRSGLRTQPNRVQVDGRAIAVLSTLIEVTD